MRKRLIFVLGICLCSIFLFVGCGNTSKGKTQTIEETLTPEQAKSKLEKDYNIPFNADNFISMIKTNETEKVKLFLQAGIDPNTRCMDNADKTYYGKTVLMIATMLGNEDIVKVLMDNGKMDINALDNSQCNVLWRVSDSGKASLVKIFVEKGTNINYVEPTNDNDALSYAIFKKQKEVVKALIENGADIKRNNSKYKISVLECAVLSECDVDMFKTLIQLGADVNAKDSKGYPPLCMALLKGINFEVIKILIDNGADVNFKAKNGTSCLNIAKDKFYNNDAKTVDYLISHGAK